MCDTLAVVGSDGLVFAKNSDRSPTEPQVLRWFPARPAGADLATQYLHIADAPAHAFLGSQPTWLWGVEHGVNEHGVAIGNEKLYTTGRPRDRAPALLGMDLVRLGLERGHDAETAVGVITDLVERHGQGGSGATDEDDPYDSSFLVADATGGWIIETCDRTWAARPLGRGGAISNRISLTTDWTRGSTDLLPGQDFSGFRHVGTPTGIADHRLATTTACVARATSDGTTTPDPRTIVPTLRHHGTRTTPDAHAVTPPPTGLGSDFSGVTVCMHVRGYQNTTASIVLTVPASDPRAWRAWAALGSPCSSLYLPVGPGPDVPVALATEASWHRFATLRDRVEAEPDALAAVRAAFDPIERRAWDATLPLAPDLLDATDAALTSLGV